MATVGHILAGMALGRAYGPGTRVQMGLRMSGLAVAACLPDTDLLIYRVRHAGPFAHRGFTHSLFAAAVCGFVAGLVATAHPRTRVFALRLGIFVWLAVSSHGVLDILSDRGSAVTMFWPFSDVRVLAPFRPIPVARFTPFSLFLVSEAKEVLAFTPLLLYALWPRKKARSVRSPT